MIEVVPVEAFSDNYIWLIRQADTPYVAIVDPGDPRPVIEALEQQGLTPVALLITHHHGDHVGGIAALTERYEMPVYGPRHEAIRGITQPLGEGDRVSLEALGLELTVLDVPGHTGGHIAYVGPGMLFCGDTLFTGGCGRLFEGTPAQMHESLKKISALPANTLVYCAHEYTQANLSFARIVEPNNKDLATRIEETRQRREQGQPTVPAALETEHRTNPFLRCDQAPVKEAAEAFAGKPLATAADVFATVRYWKDTLD